MCRSPQCYIPSFMEIGRPVPEKDFWRVFTVYGHGGLLGHVTSTMLSTFYFIVPEIFNTKFHSEQHSSFLENPVRIFECTRPWAKVKKWPWPSILIYLHKFNKMSAPTNFQVTGCIYFWKIHCFHLFPIKKLKLPNFEFIYPRNLFGSVFVIVNASRFICKQGKYACRDF